MRNLSFASSEPEVSLSVLRIVEDTMVDGPGFRTSIYAAGCPHGCPGCHNPESWDIHSGYLIGLEEALRVILSDEFADVTFTGGDPMYQARAFSLLAQKVKEQSDKSIWCYTGYTYEQLLQHADCMELLRCIDVLVDGRYVQRLRDPDLAFRGSSNQRIIDVPASLRNGQVVLYSM